MWPNNAIRYNTLQMVKYDNISHEICLPLQKGLVPSIQHCFAFDVFLMVVVQVVYPFPRGLEHSLKHYLQTKQKERRYTFHYNTTLIENSLLTRTSV